MDDQVLQLSCLLTEPATVLVASTGFVSDGLDLGLVRLDLEFLVLAAGAVLDEDHDQCSRHAPTFFRLQF